MEYKALVENETIKFSSKWVDLEKSSEVTQSQEEKQPIFSDINFLAPNLHMWVYNIE